MTDSRYQADNNGRLRVVHLLRAPVGGLFRHVCDLAREQSACGFDVGIACDSLTGSAFADSALEALAEICRLGIHRIPIQRTPGWSDISATRAISRVVRDLSPGIIRGHGAKGAAYARLLAPKIGAKAVYTPHGGSLHYSYATLSGAVYLTLERVLKRRTDGVIFESEYARCSYLDNVGLLTCPHRVIHNGLYEREFSSPPRAEDAYDFVFIGELRTIKGIEVFLDAVARVAKHQEFSVLIVGQGDLESSVRSRISEPDMANHATWSPSIHPATEAFAKGRCIVTPSLAESLPYIVLECLAASVPLLTTRVGGIPEIFGPFHDRLLPPGDSQALASAMQAVLADPDGAQQRAEGLQAFVKQHFLLPQMVEATNSFYRDLATVH